MLRAITGFPPIAYTSDSAFAAAMAPYVCGSSTTGAKKSSVATTAVAALMRTTLS